MECKLDTGSTKLTSSKPCCKRSRSSISSADRKKVDIIASAPESEVADYSSYLPEPRVLRDDVAILGTAADVNTSAVSHRLRKRALRTQDNAPSQLKLLSQPKVDGTDINSFSSYVYDEAAGFGSTIYVIDSGANVAHPVSTLSR